MNFTYQDARFCLYDDPSDFSSCDFLTYGESILLILVPFLVIAILFVPVATIYYICRCCTCGKYIPTRSFCAGEPMEKEWVDGVDGYKSDSVMGFKISAVFAAAIVIAGAIIVEIGNRSLSADINGATYYVGNVSNSLVRLLNDTLDTIMQIQDTFQEVFATSTIADYVYSAQTVGSELERIVGEIKSYVTMINGPRQIVMLVLMIIPMVAALFLLLGGFCNCPPLSCTAVVISCISLPICLILFTVHYPIGTAVSDICYFLDQATDEDSPEYSDFLASFYSCDDSSPIGSVTSLLEDAVDSALDLFCANLTDLCNMVEFPCDKNSDGEVADKDSERCPIVSCADTPPVCNRSTLNDIMNRVKIYNYYLSCYQPSTSCKTGDKCFKIKGTCGDIHSTDKCESKEAPLFCGLADPKPVLPEYCSENCTFDETKVLSAALVRYKKVATMILDLIINKILPFLRCESIVGIIGNAQDFVCVSLINTLRPLTVGSIMVAVGLLGTVIIGTLGSKRFNKKYQFHVVPIVSDTDMEGHAVEMQPTAGGRDEDEGEDEDEVSKPLQETLVVPLDASTENGVPQSIQETRVELIDDGSSESGTEVQYITDGSTESD